MSSEKILLQKMEKIERMVSKILIILSEKEKNEALNARREELRSLANFYINSYFPNSGYDKDKLSAFLKRWGNTLKSIISQCGSLDMAKKVIELAGKYYNDNGLPWTLNAVDKNCVEFIDAVRRFKK